jgi:hypothetical protein
MKVLHRYLLTALFFWSNVCLNGQYYLYDDDCLDFYGTDYPSFNEQIANEHQIIPFCRRDNFQDDQLNIIGKEIPSSTFDELHKSNISSLQLYEWSVHMDLIEEYQAFRQNQTGIKILGSNSSIYKCSVKQKFGKYCQYSFDSQVSLHIQKEVFVLDSLEYQRFCLTFVEVQNNGNLLITICQ